MSPELKKKLLSQVKDLLSEVHSALEDVHEIKVQLGMTAN
ncbi:Uncharacterised protein [Sphingobacterium spiritivorum]|nr:Uncharacterised protein [Sphingobacterium spiritivorum]